MNAVNRCAWFQMSLRVGTLLLGLVVSPLALAELPPAFQRRSNEQTGSVLSNVIRPAQDVLEKIEDKFIQVKDVVVRCLDEIALQNTLMDGTQAVLNGQLDEKFFARASIYETDTVFFREVLPKLRLQYRGTNIVGKLVLTNETMFIEAQKIMLDVRRRLVDRKEAALPKGDGAFIDYRVALSLRAVRTWKAGVWGRWQQDFSLGDFGLEVDLRTAGHERILKDQKLERRITRDWGLTQMSSMEFPPPPLQDHFPLQQRLGRMSGGERFTALEKLADTQDAEAQYLLGFAHERGNGTPLNFSEALGWYRKSAGQNFGPAVYRLGEAYLSGQGVTVDHTKAAALFRQAATQGHLPSLAFLGRLLDRGIGVPKDTTLAEEYLRHAASQGEVVALFTIAESALMESKAPAPETFNYLNLALSQRYAPAAYFLGSLHESGNHVTKSNVDAWIWFIRAGTWRSPVHYLQLPDHVGQALLRLRDSMSEAELARAIQMLLAEKIPAPMEDEP